MGVGVKYVGWGWIGYVHGSGMRDGGGGKKGVRRFYCCRGYGRGLLGRGGSRFEGQVWVGSRTMV